MLRAKQTYEGGCGREDQLLWWSSLRGRWEVLGPLCCSVGGNEALLTFAWKVWVIKAMGEVHRASFETRAPNSTHTSYGVGEFPPLLPGRWTLPEEVLLECFLIFADVYLSCLWCNRNIFPEHSVLQPRYHLTHRSLEEIGLFFVLDQGCQSPVLRGAEPCVA